LHLDAVKVSGRILEHKVENFAKIAKMSLANLVEFRGKSRHARQDALGWVDAVYSTPHSKSGHVGLEPIDGARAHVWFGRLYLANSSLAKTGFERTKGALQDLEETAASAALRAKIER
jgi:hypothetical protein